MAEHYQIPLFPLSILPIPGELVPLHIFEPRYKQLIAEAETADASFGIFFKNEINKENIGSLVKLQSVLKRYPKGESDIVVKCLDTFTLHNYIKNYKAKLYSGGEVSFHCINIQQIPHVESYELFLEYQHRRKITTHTQAFSLYEMAQELNLDIHDRYKLLTTTIQKREGYIVNQLKFQLHILKQEENSKDVFFLN